MPLTLTIIASLTVSAAGQSFAIPRAAIEEIVHMSSASLRIDQLGDAQIVTIRGRSLPLLHLEQVLGLDRVEDTRGRTVVVMNAGAELAYALCVQAVHDHEELVIKPASPAVMATGIYGGMSLPDSGVPMLMLDASGIAARAGVASEEANVLASSATDKPEEAGPEMASTLLFRDLAGQRRGIRLGVVERLEDVAGSAVAFTAGQLRVTIDGRLLPLIGGEEAALAAAGSVKLLRLSDGATEIAYAIDDVIDIVQLPPALHRATCEGPIAGVALVGGEQVELIDVYWLFAQAGVKPTSATDRPLCLIADGEDRWSREILRPLLEAAGYRVGFGQDAAEEAAVVLTASGTAHTGAAPVIRLRPDMGRAEDGSVYRYDRIGLLAEIERRVAGRRA